jgi:hypothetical protein
LWLLLLFTRNREANPWTGRGEGSGIRNSAGRCRTERILDRLREGWAYDEVAREEGLTERRARQIVAARFARPLALQAAPT